jgi:hypothetical protein
MDFQYTFRQAHQNRLEDAGVVQYRPSDGFRVFSHARRRPQIALSQRLHVVFATLFSIFTN